MDRPKIWVNVSRPGLRVPLDGGGGVYEDDIAHQVERSIYIIRRLKDGALVETDAPTLPQGIVALAPSQR